MAFKIHAYDADFLKFKTQVAAQYNGIALENVNVNVAAGDHKKAAFLALNPMGKTPVLETPDGVIFESTAMARYIARLRRDTELLGASFFESGQVDQWLDFCSLEVETQSQIVMHQIWEIAELNGAIFNAAKAKLIKAVNVLEGHLLYNTYMVGNSVTLADIALVAALHYPLQHALPLGRVPSVLRWYQTCMAQPQFEHVLGSYNLHLSNLNKVLAPKFPKGQKGGNKGGKGQQQGGKKGGKKGGQQPKKKAAQPPAPPKKKKDPKPFEGTPRPKKAIDSWKRIFAPVKAEPSSAMPKFWEWLDADDYSIWRCDYQYNSDNTRSLFTANLVGGFVQRSEQVTKVGGFGRIHILESTPEGPPYNLTGCFLFRGQSEKEMINFNADAEYWKWTKLNPADDGDRKVWETLCVGGETVEGLKVYDTREAW